MAVIGVISDTHSLRRSEARKALAGVDLIIHAGDIDDIQTWHWLGAMGKTVGVRGNCDRGTWAADLRDRELVTVEGRGIYVIHDLGQMTIEPEAAGVAVVVCGHTHEPRRETRGSVLYFNPGSAGPRRAGKPVTLGKLYLGPEGIVGEIIPLFEERSF
jgi:putative phosphoesterase